MRCQSTSRVRSSARRRSLLSLAKHCSIGLKIGRIGREEHEAGATLLDGAADGLAPVGAEHLSPATKVEVR